MAWALRNASASPLEPLQPLRVAIAMMPIPTLIRAARRSVMVTITIATPALITRPDNRLRP
jgi:hypothetical protein